MWCPRRLRISVVCAPVNMALAPLDLVAGTEVASYFEYSPIFASRFVKFPMFVPVFVKFLCIGAPNNLFSK